MKRDQRFGVVMSETERQMLNRLARKERIPAAAVIRRLIWREAEKQGYILNITSQPAHEVSCERG